MWLQDSLARLVGCFFILLFVAGCTQSPTEGVAVEQGPREVMVNSSAESPEEPQPVPQHIPTNVLPPQPVPEITIIPENKPVEDPVQACLDNCDASCKRSAAVACSKQSGVECKASCGTIIDPSACSTACSLRNANACEYKFIEFCTAKCKERCY